MAEEENTTKKKSSKIKTHASKEAARFHDTDEAAQVLRGPTDHGNDFDVRMGEEPDGNKAAMKIINCLKEKGVCVIMANAPQDLVMAAYQEAVDLYEDNRFAPPMRISDDRSKLEAMCWHDALQDEQKVCYIHTKEENAELSQSKAALRALMGNMADFGAGLAEGVDKELGIKFDRFGHGMLSCYAGKKDPRIHIDNPHGCGDPDRPTVADNGLRLSMAYYINPHWDPEVCDCAGGMDVYLTDPKETPQSAGSARSAGKLRIAPHADTLVLWVSEKMAHHVCPTTADDRWFCMTMWYLDGPAQAEAPKNLLKIQKKQARMDAGLESDED